MIAFIFHTLVNAWLIACALAIYETKRKSVRDNELHVWLSLCGYSLALGGLFAFFRR